MIRLAERPRCPREFGGEGILRYASARVLPQIRVEFGTRVTRGRNRTTEGVLATMTAIREATLRNYGIEAQLAGRFPDAAARGAEITRQARAWAEAFDANSLLALGDALTGFDLTPHVGKMTARVLYVLSRTDAIFPPALAPEVMGALQAAGVRAEYFELDSPHGHLDSGTDAAKWAPALRTFLASLA